MRLLRIKNTSNVVDLGIDIDIDDKTAIGINIQAYDMKDPSLRKTSFSNTFNIPKTALNLKAIGYEGGVQSLSNALYNSLYCDYWIDNTQIIKNSKIQVTEINDRINLFVTIKEDLWDAIKLMTWSQFLTEYLAWKGLGTTQVVGIGTYLDQFINATDGIVLPFFSSNLAKYAPDEITPVENGETIYLSYLNGTTSYNGGHFCIYYKAIFEFLEYKYGVNFLTSAVGVAGNIWDDTYAPLVYCPARALFVSYVPNGVLSGYYMYNKTNSIYAPHGETQDKSEKFLWDVINCFFQSFNIIKDDLIINNSPVMRLSRFDNIATQASVIDWSEGIQQVTSFKPVLDGYNQLNKITYSSVEDGVNLSQHERIITCGNLNIDAKENELFSIDAFIPAFVSVNSGNKTTVDLSNENSFASPMMLLSTSTTIGNINIYNIKEGLGYDSIAVPMPVVGIYSVSTEYNYHNQIVQFPKVYTIKKWLTSNDVLNIQFFKKYFINILNGYFFINKISGFNPDKSNEATTIELIQLPTLGG